MKLITNIGNPLPSPARTKPVERGPFRVGAVQHRWHADAEEHRDALSEGVAVAAGAGASLVCLQELTLSPYFASVIRDAATDAVPELLIGGATHSLAVELASRHGVFVHASLYEADPAVAPRGRNTAICVAPDGSLIATTRKVHIPVTYGYFEDTYFAGSDAGDASYPVIDVDGVGFGFPTCWDQWFPELARVYSLEGAEVLVYPTAIGSEPEHPAFDTQPLWQHVIVGNGITAGTHMIAVNRFGSERVRPDAPEITFYGSSFISDPYGRVLVKAPRDEPAVIVADLDLGARDDWLALFPFDTTRRPDTYGRLVSTHRPAPRRR